MPSGFHTCTYNARKTTRQQTDILSPQSSTLTIGHASCSFTSGVNCHSANKLALHRDLKSAGQICTSQNMLSQATAWCHTHAPASHQLLSGTTTCACCIHMAAACTSHLRGCRSACQACSAVVTVTCLVRQAKVSGRDALPRARSAAWPPCLSQPGRGTAAMHQRGGVHVVGSMPGSSHSSRSSLSMQGVRSMKRHIVSRGSRQESHSVLHDRAACLRWEIRSGG
jgi:hypothetical protein